MVYIAYIFFLEATINRERAAMGGVFFSFFSSEQRGLEFDA